MSSDLSFKEKYGPWAVVTGASGGIGGEFVKQLAAKGLNIVLVARREAVLEQVAEKLRAENSIDVRTVPADLSSSEGVDKTVSACEDLDVGLLVNNAGIELHGSFFKDDPSNHARLIALNISSVTMLAHAFGKRLIKRGKGGIIFVSSAGRWPMAWLSTYSASKAYVSNLSYIIRDELAPRGIDVLALEPGVVKTDMIEDAVEKLGWPTISAEMCVSEGITALEQKKMRISPGKKPDHDGDKAILESLERNGTTMKEKWDASRFEPGV